MILGELQRADYALLISLGSLAAALMALGFQLWNATRLDRAALKVRIEAQSIVGPGFRSLPVVTVTVVNQGKRPTKLTSLWLSFRRGRLSHRKRIPRRWRRDAAVMMLDQIPDLPQPTLPQVLDVGGEVTIYYRQQVVRDGAEKGGWKYCIGIAGASTARGRSRLVRVIDLTKGAPVTP